MAAVTRLWAQELIRSQSVRKKIRTRGVGNVHERLKKLTSPFLRQKHSHSEVIGTWTEKVRLLLWEAGARGRSGQRVEIRKSGY